jgi:hypothetical protein
MEITIARSRSNRRRPGRAFSLVSAEVQRLEQRALLTGGYELTDSPAGVMSTLDGEFASTVVVVHIDLDKTGGQTQAEIFARLALVDGGKPGYIAGLIAADRIDYGYPDHPHAALENNLAADLHIPVSAITSYDVFVSKLTPTPGADLGWEAMPHLNIAFDCKPTVVEVPGPTKTVYVDVPGPTVYVNVPGPTQTVYVNVPGPTVTVELVRWWYHKDAVWLKMMHGDVNAMWRSAPVNKRDVSILVPRGITPYGTPNSVILVNGVYTGTRAAHPAPNAPKPRKPVHAKVAAAKPQALKAQHALAHAPIRHTVRHAVPRPSRFAHRAHA